MAASGVAHEHIQRCKSIFITWTWAVGIVVSMVMGASILAWGAGRSFTQIEGRLDSHETRIGKLERIDSKIDTLIIDVRKLNADLNRH